MWVQLLELIERLFQKSGNVSNRNTEAPKAHQRSETEFNNLSNQVKDRTKPANNRCYTHVQTTDNEPKKLANGETKSPIVEKKKKTQTQGASQWMSEDEMVVHLRDLVGIGDGESRFVTRDLIGHGASAAVYSCTDTTNGKTVSFTTFCRFLIPHFLQKICFCRIFFMRSLPYPGRGLAVNFRKKCGEMWGIIYFHRIHRNHRISYKNLPHSPHFFQKFTQKPKNLDPGSRGVDLSKNPGRATVLTTRR